METPLRTAILHYAAPPEVGGVEAVMDAHARVFAANGYPVKIIAGRGDAAGLPNGAQLTIIPEIDSQHPEILSISAELEQGRMPAGFAEMRARLAAALRPVLEDVDVLIVHNVFTKHFNLPLTAALIDLIEEGVIGRCIAWGHDFTWTSPNSRSKVFPGFPWDLLRTAHPGVRYVAVSDHRQRELAELLGVPTTEVEVVYDGVDPCVWFGLSPEGWDLIQRMDLLSGDMILLMPVRITQAKNIELAQRVLVKLKEKHCRPRLVVTGPPDPHNKDSMAYYQTLLDLRKELYLEEEMCFVFETRIKADSPPLISQQIVADLTRISDLLFMPSHREGFGMPVLEAGLVGIPIISSANVPAAVEIGEKNVYLFDTHSTPEEIARMILDEVINTRSARFRKEVRQNFTWDQIFTRKIEPLLRGKPA